MVNDWLRPAVVLGALALPLAAFHGVRQDIRTTEATLRSDFKADLQAVEGRLGADNRELAEKLDRVLETSSVPDGIMTINHKVTPI